MTRRLAAFAALIGLTLGLATGCVPTRCPRCDITFTKACTVEMTSCR